MAVKEVQVPHIGTVKLYKRRGSHSIRLSVSGDGSVRVTMPSWVTYGSALHFVHSKLDWIISQQPSIQTQLPDGFKVGKNHHLYFKPSPRQTSISARLYDTEIIVSYPEHLTYSDPEVQTVARQGSIRALRDQAETLLPKRLGQLASSHGFSYQSVGIKRLKGRWGSCNQNKDIILNLFLMQLPWQLIDYVLLHELVHTVALHHGPNFWAEFDKVLPGAKSVRKRLRSYSPSLAMTD